MCIYVILHVDRVEHIRNGITNMIMFTRREQMPPPIAKGTVSRAVMGRSTDGSGPSLVHETEPEPQQHRVEVEDNSDNFE